MLGDVVTKEELPRVLHGLSQVLQGVVFRLGKRLTQKDKAKEKSMRDKEAQVGAELRKRRSNPLVCRHTC